MAKKWDSDFDQNYEIQILVKNSIFFSPFFSRSLTNLRHTAKIPTVLNSLLEMLTIPIILRKIYFLTHFRIFYRGCLCFFCEKCQKKKIFRFI